MPAATGAFGFSLICHDKFAIMAVSVGLVPLFDTLLAAYFCLLDNRLELFTTFNTLPLLYLAPARLAPFRDACVVANAAALIAAIHLVHVGRHKCSPALPAIFWFFHDRINPQVPMVITAIRPVAWQAQCNDQPRPARWRLGVLLCTEYIEAM